MSKLLTLACAAAGAVTLSATSAQAVSNQPVNALPAVAHINQVVVVERHHYRHHGYYRHHRRWYWRHHRRYYY